MSAPPASPASTATARPSLAARLAELTVEGELYEKLSGDRVRCYACAHRCRIASGRQGVCKVRFNVGGVLKVPHGYTAGLQDDPIEKKPFFHARPGLRTLSFGMLGCDFHCSYCQNWLSSQTLRDENAGGAPQPLSAKAIVQRALDRGCGGVTSTYNEPLITSEWAVAVFKLAKAAGLLTSYVSNGNATPEVLDYLDPWVDCYNVDLKSFDDRRYRRLGGTLQAVTDTITNLAQRKIWLEVVTLIVPGFNDSEEELTRMARFLAGLNPDLPWHVTAFHSDYRMADTPRTPAETLLRAYNLGKQAGLNYIYPGNLPGLVGDTESTVCPSCATLCVQRVGFQVIANHLADTGGKCPGCGLDIPGLWEAQPEPGGRGGRLSRWVPGRRMGTYPSRAAVEVVR